jgi:hypothetical protein
MMASSLYTTIAYDQVDALKLPFLIARCIDVGSHLQFSLGMVHMPAPSRGAEVHYELVTCGQCTDLNGVTDRSFPVLWVDPELHLPGIPFDVKSHAFQNQVS